MRNEQGMVGPLYHGSPHDFEKFDLTKIGTGEGAQAYGHGLYFAENPAVAKEYREALANMTVNGGKPGTLTEREFAAEILDMERGGLTRPKAIARLRNRLKPDPVNDAFFGADEMTEINAQANRVLDRLEHADIQPGGRTYKVQVRAEPEDFLDWDKPLSQQSEKVQGILEKAGIFAEPSTGIYEDTGETLLKRFGGPGPGSRKFASLGIRGIRYLDQGSRGAAGGTRNYVLFDDDIIDVLEKGGIDPNLALKMLGLTAGISGAAAATAPPAVAALKRKWSP